MPKARLRHDVPLDHHPVGEHARIEVAANEPQHTAVRDPLLQPSHQHVVVDPVEELLQVHVHDQATPLLHVALRPTHRVMGTSARPEAVACF